jgi:DNA polymerase III subunit gamma/tau
MVAVTDERTVWYRKWRPRTFAEITGQEHVTRTLRNAVAQGRVAHAYLLTGPRGTGKTTTARVLAKAVNCLNPDDGEPCDRCESCVAVREGRALDLVEMDAASNRGIDDIRELRERVGYAASGGRYKVYLIDEVHELTQQAFDALLKTLEEPPAHVIFVLATTDAHRVPATILSRCQRFDLTRVRLPDLTARLVHIAAAEGVRVEDEALAIIGRAATGSLRDAVNLLEQVAGAAGDAVTAAAARSALGLTGDTRALSLARAAVEGDLAGGLELIAAVRDDGVDLRQFCRDVTARLRSLLLLRAGVEDAGDTDAETRDALRGLAAETDVVAITHALRAFAGADFRADPQSSLPLELALADVALRAPAAAESAVTATEPAVRRPALPAAPAPAAASETPPAPAPAPATQDDRRTALLDVLARAEAGPPSSAAATPPRPAVPAASRPHPNEFEESWPANGAPPAAVDEDGEAAVLTPSSELDDVRSRYRDIYERVRMAHRLSGAQMQQGDIVALDNEGITFGFPHTIQVERFRAGTKGHQVLSDAVAQVFGRPIPVHCVHTPNVEDRLRTQPARRSHLLDEAIKLGARPLDGP